MQRTLRFAQHLPRFGWQPIVLTIDPRAYEAVTTSVGNEVPPGLEVHRAFGVDAARHLSLFGRYPRSLALPDRWASWRLGAVRRAKRILKSGPIDAIWSTFPVATAHRIALDIAQRARIPWIAEFRDPMWQGDYPPDAAVNRAWRSLESEVFARADSVIVVTPGAAATYAQRFPQLDPSRLLLIENGYDEESFVRAAADVARARGEPPGQRPLVLLHSGLVYPSERDPTQLFQAVQRLKRAGRISDAGLRIVLRAPGNEKDYSARLAQLDIADVVRLEPAIDYLPALREMLTVDGLLLLQASNCNAQVPAKLYEYLRAGRPILALTDSAGDTARILRHAGIANIARLESVEEIESALMRFLEDIRRGASRLPVPAVVAGYSREEQSGQLARALDRAVAHK